MELERKEIDSVQSQMERFLCGYQEKLDEALFVEYFPHTLYRLLGINLKKVCGNQKDKIASGRKVFSIFFRVRRVCALPCFFRGRGILLYL